MKNGIFQERQESRKEIKLQAESIIVGCDESVLSRGHRAPPLLSQGGVESQRTDLEEEGAPGPETRHDWLFALGVLGHLLPASSLQVMRG